MGAPVSAATIVDRLAEMIGPRATVARGVLEAARPAAKPIMAACRRISWCFRKPRRRSREIVKLCASAGMPIVPFGAGTSLEGNTAAVAGGSASISRA